MNTNSLKTQDFYNGIKDYHYLMNRSYPEKGSLKLVGDRYRLNRDQRTILYRGISSEKKAVKREERLITDIPGKYLVIDGYNVLFTLLNYRLGRLIFISNDNIVRDVGRAHGKLHNEDTFLECLDLLVDYLSVKKPDFIHVFIDSPVSHSAKHSRLINKRINTYNLQGICEVVRSPDTDIQKFKDGVLATSDTLIIDKTQNKITDIPRQILNLKFQAEFLDLNRLLINN